MAKGNFSQSGVATNNVTSLPTVNENVEATLKATFDKYGVDNNAFINNIHISELEDDTEDASGAHKIGLGLSAIVADNVADALEENRILIDQIGGDATRTKNFLINGYPQLWQRGTEFLLEEYTADRWATSGQDHARSTRHRLHSSYRTECPQIGSVHSRCFHRGVCLRWVRSRRRVAEDSLPGSSHCRESRPGWSHEGR